MSKLLWIFTTLVFFIISIQLSDSCSPVGCNDCYSWCPTINKDFCDTVALLRTGCRKTCNACIKDHPGCNKLGCEQVCRLTPTGKAYCACYDDTKFKVQPDGTCSDVNECEQEGYCASRFGASRRFCQNLVGSVSCQGCPANKGWIGYVGNENKCCKVDDTETCGQSSLTKAGGRIVGGNDTNSLMWPAMAHITIGQYLCGGTLINKRWILSAAHCFPQRRGHLGSVTVVLGASNVADNQGEVTTQTFQAEDIIVHVGYRWPTHDIALIKLNKDIIVTNYVSPACLPSGEEPETQQKCFAVGYGATSFGGSKARQMQSVDLPIVDINECERVYRNRPEEVDTNRMMCAGYNASNFEEKDACQGDSGGPILCQRCDSCNFYVAGVTSFGKGCAEKGYYGVYTKVTAYEDWIAKQLATGPVVKKTCKKYGWGEWSDWSGCTVTCGVGKHTRQRVCTSGSPGDPYCEGGDTQVKECDTTVPCGGATTTTSPTATTTDTPVITTTTSGTNAFWSDYEPITECSVTCGMGTQIWQRQCLGNARSSTCEGDSFKEMPCEAVACAYWGEYGDWTPCTKTCEGGMKFKLRECINGVVGSSPECPAGDEAIKQTCNEQQCPHYSDWVWGECTVTCGTGTQQGNRECVTYGVTSATCEGDATSTRECNTQLCPRWSDYTQWSTCSVTCNGGTQTRTRDCIGGKVGEIGCHIGGDTDTQSCNSNPCPVWGSWVMNRGCSVTCGQGTQQYNRVCTNGGVVGQPGCMGLSTKVETCTLQQCAYWSAWSAWGKCTVSCGDGTQTRTRSCIGGSQGQGECLGAATSTQDCKQQACTTVAPPSSGKCGGLVDRVSTDTCGRYKEAGYCDRYESWMNKYCTKTCCSVPGCVIQPDLNRYCKIYYDVDPTYCNFKQFLRSCNTSCGRCK